MLVRLLALQLHDNSHAVTTLLIKSHKCTKHQFIHLLTATFKDLHVENSKITKGDIARITLTVCQCAAEYVTVCRHAPQFVLGVDGGRSLRRFCALSHHQGRVLCVGARSGLGQPV